MNSGINRDEWLKALNDAGLHDGTDDQDAVTAAEFGAMFGLPRLTAERRLRALEQAGKATRTRKVTRSVNGRSIPCVAYRLTS